MPKKEWITAKRFAELAIADGFKIDAKQIINFAENEQFIFAKNTKNGWRFEIQEVRDWLYQMMMIKNQGVSTFPAPSTSSFNITGVSTDEA